MEKKMSGSACRYWFFLLWSSIVLVAGIFLFTGGFLLKRQVLSDKAVCVNKTHPDSCNVVPKQFNKAIIVIIDALKYEFATYNRSNDDGKAFRNRLPAIQKLVDAGEGRLYEFLADPPTTTMQRLKGLTTGSLPTFIDVSSNFASYEINEDNIIDQLVVQGKKVVFAGDDTWMGLFPGRFVRSYPFPSFDVWDLDTVDRGVNKHLFEELKSPEKWDVLIGHYLGVDHAGHKYGPLHAEMTRKLDEMNVVIERVSRGMPEDCVLFVMGDHGMTMTGDHGGDSRDELSATLFVHSKKFLKNDFRLNPHRQINQVDFVPTFSLLMGMPIPFSNIGKIIGDVVSPSSPTFKQIQYFRANIDQVYTYLETYRQTAESSLPKSSFDLISQMTEEFRSQKSTSVLSSADIEMVLAMGNALLSKAKAICQEKFIEFNLNLIASGLTLNFLHVFLLLILLVTPTKSFMRNIINYKFLAVLVVSSLFGAMVGAAVSLIYMGDDRELFDKMVVMTSTGSSLMVFGFTLLWKLRNSLSEVVKSLTTDRVTLLHYTVSFVSCFGLLSNSYVINEASIQSFCLSSLLVGHLFKRSVKKEFSLFTMVLATLGLIRLSGIYFRCREEQQNYCSPSDFHMPIGNLPQSVSRSYKNWRFFSTIFSVAITVGLPYIWQRICGNLNGLSVPVALAKYSPPTVGLCLIFNWALQGLPAEMAATLLPWQHKVLAQMAFVICLVSTGFIIAIPNLLFVYNTGKVREEFLRTPNEGVKTYYNILKSNWKQHLSDTSSGGPNKILVYGIGTGISASYVLVATLFCLTSMLLVGDGLCPSICLMMMATASYLLVSSHSRICDAFHKLPSPLDIMMPGPKPAVKELTQVPWSTIIGWHVMESLFFYSTGHQPTFPSIQWNSAFIAGLSGSEYGSSESSPLVGYVLPAVLIGWNTFVSRLWFGLLLPLLMLSPFAIWLAFPSLRPTLEEYGDKPTLTEMAKGEVVLIDNKEATRSQLFTLCVKYCVVQCFKSFFAMLAAALLRRHLMIWKIFAPRFIFEAVGFMVSLGAVLVGYILFLRIQTYVCNFYNGVLDKEK